MMKLTSQDLIVVVDVLRNAGHSVLADKVLSSGVSPQRQLRSLKLNINKRRLSLGRKKRTIMPQEVDAFMAFMRSGRDHWWSTFDLAKVAGLSDPECVSGLIFRMRKALADLGIDGHMAIRTRKGFLGAYRWNLDFLFELEN